VYPIIDSGASNLRLIETLVKAALHVEKVIC
jgi:hypothetical protein